MREHYAKQMWEKDTATLSGGKDGQDGEGNLSQATTTSQVRFGVVETMTFGRFRA